MLLATFVIAVATVVNVAVFTAESVSGSHQTAKLVGYGKMQANAASDIGDAAQQFSDTAEDINSRMSDAVDQLKASSDNAKKSLDASIESALQDRRPWVGIQGFDCSGCSTRGTNGDEWTEEMRGIWNKPEYLKVGELFAAISNSGRTPAIQMKINLIIVPSPESKGIPDWDSAYLQEQRHLDDIVKILPEAKRYLKDVSPVIVLPPGAPQKLTLLKNVEYQRNFFDHDKTIIYILGQITYYDVTKTTKHTTRFCLFNSAWATFNDFAFCQSGNTMD
jgi:hypothetical protein